MAHVQKLDLVFQRNGRVHLNRWGCHFSRLLAAEECGSADSNCIDRVPTYSGRLLATHSIRVFPLPCVTLCHQIPNALCPPPSQIQQSTPLTPTKVCEQECPLILTLGNRWYSANLSSCHSSKTFVMQKFPYALTNVRYSTMLLYCTGKFLHQLLFSAYKNNI